jgi:hypothetical protein
MTDEERPPYRPMCSLNRTYFPPGTKLIRSSRHHPPGTRPMKVWFEWEPPSRTERPWVDDPRFGLQD